MSPKPYKQYYRKCIVQNCNAVGETLFRLPKDPERCLAWLKNSNRLDLTGFTSDLLHNSNSYRMCSLHFENGMFAGSFGSLSKSRLKRHAIPTINLENLAEQNQGELSEIPELAIAPTLFEPQPGTSQMSDVDLMKTQGFSVLESSKISPQLGTSKMIIEETETRASAQSSAPESLLTPALHEPQPGTSKDNGQIKSQECPTQTPSSLSWNTPRKHELRLKVKRLTYEKRNAEAKLAPNREEVITYLKQHLSEGLINFLKTNLDLQEKHPQGYRYSNEYKQFALTVYFLGPNVYKFMSQLFRLPSKSTLYRLTQNWNISPGFNNFIFGIVQSRINVMGDREKHCILCIDEMSIKRFLFYNNKKDLIVGFHETFSEKKYKHAKNVLVVMARGLFSNWKQPLVYFFVNVIGANEISKILHETITRLIAINMTVHAVVSDQGSNFVQFVKKAGITPDRPFFIVNEKKIFYFFDPPHLLKASRNNLFKYILAFLDGTTAQKTFIEKFYNTDKKLPLRLAPKLSDEHIYPNNFKKMRVKLAAQVLSATVAAGLNTYIALEALPGEAFSTANFIDEMDKLFDLFNSSRVQDAKDFNRPFMGTEKQINFLNHMYDKFSTTKIIDKNNKDVTSSVKFLYGWRLTIKSLLGLWDDVKADYTSIYTRRLNQDPLENFFGTLRQQGGSARNPTPSQVNQGFKKIFCLSYFQHSEQANCLEDFDIVLGSISSENLQNFSVVTGPEITFSNLKIGVKDYPNLDMAHKNALNYVCGYLLKKCREKHECEICESYSTEHENLSNDVFFTYFKAYENKYKDTFGNLLTPAENFVEFVFQLEKIFSESFTTLAIHENVGVNMKNKLQTVHNPHPCKDFPHNFFLSLFVRLKIHHILKHTNWQLKQEKLINNQKLKNVKHI